MKNNEKNYKNDQPCTASEVVEPKDSFQMVNNYGTYEIQPTADTENQYPAIAQGFNKKIIETDRQNKHYKGDRFEKSKP